MKLSNAARTATRPHRIGPGRDDLLVVRVFPEGFISPAV